MSKHFNIVEQPGQGTMRIQIAITNVFTSYDDLKGYQFVPIAAAVTGAARASGIDKKSVRVMSEARLVDSVDGELLLEAIDMKAGKEVQDDKSGILLADVVPILDQGSKRLTNQLIRLKQIIIERS